MRLSALLSQCRGLRRADPRDARDPDVFDVVSDSREAGPGALFVALPGRRVDGAAFIADAVRAGAVAVCHAGPPAADPGVPVLLADAAGRAPGEAADVVFGHPSRRLSLVGVTGTNGKTTTAYLLRHLFRAAGRRCGMIGTIEYDDGGASAAAAPLTTPDAARFTRMLAAMVRNGCDVAAAEVSSHALAQDRVHPHRFAAAIFTNLTRDHLDYHGGMDAYAQAKKRLFDGLASDAHAVINADDPAAARMLSDCRARKTFYTLHAASDPAAPAATAFPGAEWVFAKEESAALDGVSWTTIGPDGATRAWRTTLIGRHNLQNILGAWLAARALGLDDKTAARALDDFPGVPGRLERVTAPEAPDAGLPAVFVDYAHTDDALRTALSVLRPLTRGRLWVVFGCGGDRDRGKRPLMARAAEAAADRVVITSDNPRTEDPERIMDDIANGLERPRLARRVADRALAIDQAIREAAAGDTVLLAGKGHENCQIVGETRYPLDDRALAGSALARRLERKAAGATHQK